jgi:hypothetical protein
MRNFFPNNQVTARLELLAYSVVVIWLSLATVLPTSALGSYRVPFTPRTYIDAHGVLFQGYLISHTVLTSEEDLVPVPSFPGWYYSTRRAVVVVEEVYKNKGFQLSAGDTITFDYPSSNTARNKDYPDRVLSSSGFQKTIRAPLGYSEIFGIRVDKNGILNARHYYHLTPEEKNELRDFLDRIVNDPLLSGMLY